MNGTNVLQSNSQGHQAGAVEAMEEDGSPLDAQGILREPCCADCSVPYESIHEGKVRELLRDRC